MATKKWGAESAEKKFKLDFADQPFRTSRRFLDLLDADPVHSWCALVGCHHFPGRFQGISPVDPVIQSIKPELRLLLGLFAQLRPQRGEFLRNGNPVVKPAIDLLMSKRDTQGRWKMEYTYNGKTWADNEQKGQSSKWVTLRALRVLKDIT